MALLSAKRCWLRLVECRCGVALGLLVARLVLLLLVLLVLLVLLLLLVCGASLLPHGKDLALRVALVEAELRACEIEPR